MKDKNNKPPQPDLVEDDRWKFKGGPLQKKKYPEPTICSACQGKCVIEGEFIDEICQACDGEGVIWQ